MDRLAASQPPAPPKIAPGPLALIGALWVVLSLNLVLSAVRFQPNVLTWDQWDFLQPLFDGRGAWELFSYQHGPHRQGLGFLVTSWILQLTAWDTRCESLWIVALLSLSSLLAVRLKWKLTGTLTFADAWVPLVGLTLGQFEAFLFTPNASHSAFPLAVLLAVGNMWLARSPLIRFAAGGGGAFVLTFTGFGLFGGAMLTLLLAAATLRHAMSRHTRMATCAAAGLAVALAGWFLFGADYVFTPAVPGFRFPWTPAADYVRFILLMLAHAAAIFGPGTGAYLAGGMLAGPVAVAVSLLFWRWLRRFALSPGQDVQLLLAGAGILFVCNTAVGRVSGGVDAGAASRYLTLLLPLWLGFYLSGVGSSSRIGRALPILSVWFVALCPYRDLAHRPLRFWPGTLGLTMGQYVTVESYTTAKAAWVDTFLKTQSVDAAQAAQGEVIYPAPAATHLEDKLRFLREHRLSFFAPPGGARSFLPWGLREKAIWDDRFPAWNRPQPLGATTRLTFVTRRAGFMVLPLATMPNPAATGFTLSVRYRGREHTVAPGPPATTLAVPVDAGFNILDFHISSGPARDLRLVAGPVRSTDTPPAGAILLDELAAP